MEQQTKKELRLQRQEQKRIAAHADIAKQRRKRLFIRCMYIAVGVAGVFAVWNYFHASAGPQYTNQQLMGVLADDHVLGNRQAPVVLVEYADFECPACASYHPILKQLNDAYGDRLAIVFRHFPLTTIHQSALLASRAAVAADRQGKFALMHNALFERQREWSRGDDEAIIRDIAQELGLDVEQFLADIKSSDSTRRVSWDQVSGRRLGVTGTPTFFLNGQLLQNPGSFEQFAQLIDAALTLHQSSALNTATQNTSTAVHIHADVKMYINDAVYDLGQDKYQSTDEQELDEHVHFHDNNGNIIHLHTAGVTLPDFFETLGIIMSNDCVVVDGRSYCGTTGDVVEYYVNNIPQEAIDEYVIADEDRILITINPSGQQAIEQQLKSVTDEACIYSETCPERGSPPTEGCVGGLGTKC